MFKRLFSIALFTFSASIFTFSQTSSQYQTYINKYYSLAQEQMSRYCIPASITLAQGLLESAAGQSSLATKANNHFGIKVSSGWTGPYVLKNDDKPNEKFRKYNSVQESYEDHSQFLLKPRYASLFKLDIKDYSGWAKGLKSCGYATSPTYANSLINIIEQWHLYEYDRTSEKKFYQVIFDNSVNPEKIVDASEESRSFFEYHDIRYNNKNYYVVVCKGDTYKSIAEATGVSKRRLIKYNELSSDYQLKVGDILYLEQKHKKADKSMYGVVYVVKKGQSMHDIAQQFGMRISSLYKMNHLDENYVPKVGDFLRVY